MAVYLRQEGVDVWLGGFSDGFVLRLSSLDG